MLLKCLGSDTSKAENGSMSPDTDTAGSLGHMPGAGNGGGAFLSTFGKKYSRFPLPKHTKEWTLFYCHIKGL